jgi:ATP-binding cassette subfamily B protein
MPQTREHLDILSLLGIEHGILVITKADLVEEEWIDIVKEDVAKAANRAGLKDYIDALPGGLDTILSEDGGNLSGGQRQRISLARVLLKNSPIYIFDEPTASLDPDTEKQIVKKIDETVKKNGGTAIIISHNANALVNCDEIKIIREGKIT